MSDKYDERPTVADPGAARARGEALMESWEIANAFRGATVADFATPGENVMIVPSTEVKKGDHIVRFTGSEQAHDLRVLSAASARVSGRYCISLHVTNEITVSDSFNLLLHPDAHVTIERPDYNL